MAACVASPAALATVQCRTTPIPFTSTSDIYINLVTAATGAGGPTAGWDIDIYPSTTGFAAYWGGAASLGGGVAATTDGNYVVLASGAAINAASLYSKAAIGTAFSAFYVPTGVTNGYLGVKFVNEATANAINFGWISFTATSAAASAPGAGFPATINGWCYQDDGSAITAGTTPVSLQKFSVD
ncbi:MAG: hypothetical protein WBP11_14210 [Dokdonella sp.]